MLQQILDNIEGILVELIDNQIDFDFDVKDKRDKFLRFDIRFFPEFIRDGGLSRYFPYLEFYGRDGKLKPYIKEALLTLDTYLKNKLMYVKVHSLFGNEGIMMSIPEFTRIEGSMATSIKMFTIGVSVNHLARGKTNRDIKEKRINSYSQFINETFDKNSVNEYDLKDYCETNLAYLMDDGLKVEPDFYNGSEYNELDELSVLLSWGGHRRKWSEIKDHIIPFLHRLRNEYELDEVYFGNDPDTAEYRNKFFRFSVKDWDKPTVNGIGYNKETHLSYDELETLPDETFINKIIFWVKI
jgi:hypothetical protein